MKQEMSADAKHEDRATAEAAAVAKLVEAWGSNPFVVTKIRSDWFEMSSRWRVTVVTESPDEETQA